MDRRFFTATVIGWAVLSSISLAAAYSGGSGTAADPYQIANVSDFQQLSATPTDWNKSFILTADIVFDPNNPAHIFSQAPIAPNTSTQFTGIFDGDGHTISKLTITASTQDHIGLFGYVGSGGQIRNLGVKNVNITCRNSVGGLVGENMGLLTSCYATGSVSGTTSVGGLVGYNYGDGSLTSCYATGTVSGVLYVGGLVGENDGSSANISNCYATGMVGGGTYVGGLVGYNNYGTLTSCYATGSVSFLGTLTQPIIGGIVGKNYRGTLTSCYATGAVSGSGEGVGGLVGWNSEGTLTACFWDIQTSGTSDGVGVVDPYPSGVMGKTTVQMKNIQIYLNAGWLFIQKTKTIGDWVMPDDGYPELAWQVYSPITIPNLKGLTKEQTREALDTAGLSSGESYSVYDVSIAAGLVSETYPKSGTVVYAELTPVHILLAKDTRYSGGDGITVPYQIAHLGDWIDLMSTPTDWNKSFILTADIDLAGQAFTQAPIAPDTSTSSDFQGIQFKGVFDGNSHTLSNLTIDQPTKEFISLFGYVGSGSKIQNLGVKNVILIGDEYVGGLVGWNSGTITACYSTGSVSGAGYNVGGLAGYNYYGTLTSCYATSVVYVIDLLSEISSCAGGLVGGNYGTLTSCYATGAVSGTDSAIGGLVGWSYGSPSTKISNCYATGAVSGGSHVGGLVGGNYGTLTSCYATGLVSGNSYIGGLAGSNSSTITACFWDIEASGQATSAGGTGKTTAEMQTLSTFTSAGWDLSNTDGDVADWMMLREGKDYPRLAWQPVIAGDIAGLYGVDMADLMELADNWLKQGCPLGCGQADINGSGMVDMGDFAILATGWQQNIDITLQGHWKLDNAAGIVAIDSSGNLRDGILMNGPVWTSSGKLNGTLQFDGVDDYVEITGYKGITGTASRTCCAWIKTTGSTGNMIILDWGATVSGQQWLFGIFSSGKLAIYAGGPYIQTNALVTDGQWHHVAAVLQNDGSPSINEIKLYIDGALQSVTYSGTTAINTVSGPNVIFGSYEYNGQKGFFFPGLMDDVRIYSRVLSVEEICTLAGPLVGRWTMDDDTASTTVVDSAANKNGTFSDPTNPNTSYHHRTDCQEGTGSLNFDGVDDYVEITGYKGITGTASRTCCAWIKTTGSTGNMIILDWGATVSGQQWLFGIFLSGKLTIYAGGPYIQTNALVTDGQWHHVAAVLQNDGSPSINEIKLYIDGALQSVTYSGTTVINTVSGPNVIFGSYEYNGQKGSFFPGLMDDVRIYNKALSGEQIEKIF